MKLKLLLIFVPVTLLLLVLAAAVMAQEPPGEVPSPYTGLKNPFAWDDTSARESGKKLYQQSCLGCHGANGDNIARADFSTADFSQNVEGRPDFYFWRLSEGKIDEGMPSYKSSLSEEQRWQVLTYLRSLGKAVPPEVTPPAKPPAEEEKGILQLTVPEQAQSGQPLTMSATLQDNQGKPIGNALVKFFIRVDFFASGLMEIEEAVTNEQGVATFEYVPQLTGNIQIVARHEGGSHETAVTVSLAETAEPFYQPQAGIRLPAPGKDVFIGPKSALELGEMGEAPTSAFRLPGGILSWLLIVVATVMLIWGTYFRVLYQLFRIPVVSEIEDTNTRLVPLIGMVIAVAGGIVLVLLLLTGPYSHFHLLR